MAASEELASYRSEAKALKKELEVLLKERAGLKRGTDAFRKVDIAISKVRSRMSLVDVMITRTSRSAETAAKYAKKDAVGDIASRTAAAKVGEGASVQEFASEYKKAKSDVRSGRSVGKGKGTTSKTRGRGEGRMIAEAQQEVETRAKAETKTKAGLNRPGARGAEEIRLEASIGDRAARLKHVRDLAAQVESGERRISSLDPRSRELVQEYLKAEKPAPAKKTSSRKPKAEKPLAGVQSPEDIRQAAAKAEKAKMAAPQPKPTPKPKVEKPKVEKPKPAAKEKPAKKTTTKKTTTEKAATEKAKKAAKETVAKKAATPTAEKPKRSTKPKAEAKAAKPGLDVVKKRAKEAARKTVEQQQIARNERSGTGGTQKSEVLRRRAESGRSLTKSDLAAARTERLGKSAIPESVSQVKQILNKPSVRNALKISGKLANRAMLATMIYDVIKDPSMGQNKMDAWAKKNPDATMAEIVIASAKNAFGMDMGKSKAVQNAAAAKRAGRMIPADRGRDKGARPYTEGRRADLSGRKASRVQSPQVGSKTSQNRSVARLGATGGTHTVKRGDTLWDIAQSNKTTVSALLKANPVIAERRKAGKTSIYSGSKVRIPGKR